jgi:hypothetical protein
MTPGEDREFAGHLLTRLEDLELPLLSWGVTIGTLSEAEVLETISLALAHSEYRSAATPEDIRDLLEDQALLFRVPGSSPRQYRTRLGETLRLAAQLRQLFPPHGGAAGAAANWWQSGRRLVADYRLHVAARLYPRRDIPLAAALSAFSQTPGWNQVQEDVASSQIGTRNLARFQVDATRVIYSALSRQQPRGVIIGAGTSSGKTLAFYLPAFAAIAEHATGVHRRVHTLALYPRKELLRDQLRDAVITAQAVEEALTRGGRRPVRLAALYGDTPWSPDSAARRDSGSQQGWPRRQAGLICPYLGCPACPPGDAGELIWHDDDRHSGSERLICSTCHAAIPDGRLALTRRSMQARPPDLLFTTTEMLNRYSANPELGPLLGWAGQDPPSLVLLDEVHTYSGSHGAQVALLLRRWRHAVRKPVTFVGLSATLKEATRFFGQMTGLPQGSIDYISPSPDCMDEAGRDYAIALRGDPVTGTSLLSTSIQAAMLFGRVLDPPGRPFLFGSTGFLFTDDLDVTNRFYDDLRDAEGGQFRSGRGGRKPVLAGLRSPDLPHQADRYRDGQSWDLAEKTGHHLDPDLHSGELRVGRTSSQDVGVDADADLIVATASLEVGFDDPRTGLILQHKAPHDPAAFIQRRGRAGRQRGTRPVTLIALSDYGRDRLAYQGYETLFAPQLVAKNLPVGNRYALKIQAAQALLDWLGRDLRRVHGAADPRILLTAPERPESRAAEDRSRRWIADRLHDLLTDSGLQDQLARHLQAALQVSADEAQALLWEQPRSLLLAVIPTALRRLTSNWQPIRPDHGGSASAMLPEFVTRALFDPLNVPEVEFELPFDTGREDERLPIARALREAVPGRVSRRYGYKRDEHRTWIPVLATQGTLELDDNIVPSARVEGLWHPSDRDPAGIQVLRPYRIRLSAPPTEVADQSQGIPQWATQILIPGRTPPIEADVPEPSPWRRRINSAGFATHAAGNPIEIRRMTAGADCEVIRGRQKVRRAVRYTYQGALAALGFGLSVDAMRIEAAPLDLASPAVQAHLTSPQWRWLAFMRTVSEDGSMAKVANTFQRAWLALIYITAFALAGFDSERTVEEIRTALSAGSWRDNLARILQVLYRDENQQSPGQGSPATDRLVAALTDLSHDSVVVDALDRAGQLLISRDIAQRTAELARRAYRDTLAAAILAAALRACPDAQDDDLIVDVILGRGPEDAATIWLSETAVGGLGIIEHLAEYYGEDPRRFWDLVAAAQQPNEYEYTDMALRCLLQDIVHGHPHGAAATAMAGLRSAHSAADAERALQMLRAAWTELDGPPRHSAVAALTTRLLRPGSSPDTDAACLSLITGWGELEQRFGFEVDARVIAFAVGSSRLRITGRRMSADQAFSMLWPRGAQARNIHLQHYQPYMDPERPMILDRLLLAAAHDESLPQIDVTQPDWPKTYQATLAATGAAELACPAGKRQALADALARVPALHVDRDVLRLYGEVTAITREGSLFRARIELREALQ